jgi:hypothetical protein
MATAMVGSAAKVARVLLRFSSFRFVIALELERQKVVPLEDVPRQDYQHVSVHNVLQSTTAFRLPLERRFFGTFESYGLLFCSTQALRDCN